MSATQGKIPALWEKFDNLVPVDYQHGERVYGVYYNYESDHNGEFDVLAGFDGDKYPKTVKLTRIDLPEAKYLVFTCKGDMPQIAIDAWTQVWQYFSTDQPEYERLFTVDYEYYPGPNEIQVHIAIR